MLPKRRRPLHQNRGDPCPKAGKGLGVPKAGQAKLVRKLQRPLT